MQTKVTVSCAETHLYIQDWPRLVACEVWWHCAHCEIWWTFAHLEGMWTQFHPKNMTCHRHGLVMYFKSEAAVMWCHEAQKNSGYEPVTLLWGQNKTARQLNHAATALFITSTYLLTHSAAIRYNEFFVCLLSRFVFLLFFYLLDGFLLNLVLGLY
jgi:hypothetical protein